VRQQPGAIQDYDILIQASDSYCNDAVTIDNIVNEIHITSSQLKESVECVLKTINNIALATQECATGTSEIADKSSNIFNDATEVLRQANNDKNIASVLYDEIQFFKLDKS
jgi:methyl-accepting chemotaxis protein